MVVSGSPNILQVSDLVKRYPGVRAVDGVSFCIAQGACFGLLGPNGAGKTTTLEILEGIIDADEGSIRYRGLPRDNRYRDVIGIQFQTTAMQDFQTVREALALFSSFYGRNRDVEELIGFCDLGDLLDRDTRKLSGGQRQRLLLAIALVNDPEIVFLDEPTTGLDPQSRRNFWRLIDRIRHEGKTVLLTTHYMEEARVLCDQIAIMDRGRIIEQGMPETLLAKHFPKALIRLPKSAFDTAKPLPDGFEARGTFAVAATDDIDPLLARLSTDGVAMDELHVSSPTLDDLFLKLTGHGLRES